ncbi:MAG: tetratricopeptide repeat protein [Negativicutes bacterium]|nr:tetratricopeptide repeat protein [Negativicutes bacterium]
MTALLSSKLSPPYAGTKLIARPRLLNLLGQPEGRKATVLTAPAGYGKSVLTVQLAAVCSQKLVWYQLDEYDNDLAVFLHYFVAGVKRHYPAFGNDILAFIAQGDAGSRLRLLVTAMVNGLEEHAVDGLFLVLDDYHLITDPAIHGFVQDMLVHLPAFIHIVIASRTEPALSLTRLKLSGEVCCIGIDELRFTPGEINEYLAANGHKLSEPTLLALESKTVGWPVALRLIQETPSGIAAFLQGDGAQAIYDYLVEEVYDRQPEHVREFLTSTSVLEELTPAFCDNLLNRTDSGQIFDSLEKQQLFLIPLAGEQKSYRYHHLFREFLRSRLETTPQSLLSRAGLLAWRDGQPEIAAGYLSAAGAYEDLILVIKAAGDQVFERGLWQTVARWLEPLPPESLADDPWLGLYKAKVEAYRGRMSEAESWVTTAAGLFAKTGDQAGLADSRLLQARFLRCRGRCAEAMALLELVNQSMAEEPLALTLEKQICLGMMGRFGEAEKVLVNAVKAAKQAGNDYALAHLMTSLGNIYWTQGKYPQALQQYQKAINIAPDHLLPSYYMQDFTAVIYLDWGELELALDYAKRSVAYLENLSPNETLPSAYLQLAAVYCEQGEWRLAEDYFHKAINQIRQNSGEHFYLAMNLIFLADCLGRQGRWTEARARIDEALAEVPEQPGVAWYIWAFEGLVRTGGVREGQKYLSAAIAELERIDYKRGLCFAYAFQAWLLFGKGELAAAGVFAGKSLPIAAELNFLQLFVGRYDSMQPVLKLGLESGVEITFVQRILVRLGDRSLGLLRELAGHADPAVRHRTIVPLAEIGGGPAGEILRRLTADPDQEVRDLARMAGRQAGSPVIAGTIKAAPLQLITFGSFQTFLTGQSDRVLRWRSAKTRDLLAYLAHRQEPVSKERILEDLWPDVDLENGTAIFHTTIYRLRRSLDAAGGKDLISYNGSRYQLRPDCISADRQRFQELLATGLRPDTAPDRAVLQLEEAVGLYRGDYLEDLDYPWLIPLQESLRHAYVVASLFLARYYLTLQDCSRAVARLKPIESLDPFSEEIQSLIMTAYAKEGNLSAVKKQYQKLEATLKRELGLSPSRTIRELYLNLIR